MKLMDIDKIITKVLAGQANQEELQHLESWKAQGEANLQLLQEHQDLYRAAQDMEGYQGYDADQAWANVSEQISETQVSSSIWLWLAIFAGAAIAVYYGLSQHAPPPIPGHYAAAQTMQVVTLADGTVVTLDKGSSLDVPVDYLDTRTVQLEGRAFFDVVEQPHGSSFMVELERGVVTVVGTSFSIIDVDGKIEVAVAEGHVVYQLDRRRVDMYAGDKVQLIDGSIVKTPLNDNNYYSWQSQELIFKEMLLLQAIRDVERHFGVSITVVNAANLQSCKISGTYSEESLQQILQEWELLIDLSYTSDENGLILIESARCI